MIISIDTEKAFNKIRHPSMIKSIQQTRQRRKLPQHNEHYILKIHNLHHTQR